jgi:hypothetical protein
MGMRQLYLRGREIRKRYIDENPFLSKEYEPAEIEAYSSFESRVVRSAMSYFAGLYPES